MSCKFSCFLSFTESLKENDVGVFHSDSGDTYTVKYRSNVCRDLLLTIEWGIPKQTLVTVKLYNTTFKRCFSSRGIVVNGKKTVMKLRGAFNVSSSQNYKVLCVINLIPYIKFDASKDITSQSFDSGFAEPDFQMSPIEGHNDFHNNANCRRENVEEHRDNRNIINVEGNEVLLSEFESSDSVIETEQDLQSKEKDPELGKTQCKDVMNMIQSNVITSEKFSHTNETEIALTLINMDNLISYNQNDQTVNNDNECEALESERYFKYKENFDNDQSSLKNILIENKEDTLINKHNIKINEFVSSDDIPITIDDCTESKMQDLILNADIVNEGFGKEKKEGAYVNHKLKLIDVKMKKSEKKDDERYLEMEVDISQLSSENMSASSDKNNLYVKKVKRIDEMLIPRTNFSNFNEEIKSIPALINDTNKLCIDDKSETIIDLLSIKDNSTLESTVISEKNIQFLRKDLTSENTATIIGDQEALRGTNKDKQLPTEKCKSPQINFQEKPDEIKKTKMNRRTVVCSESVLSELPSSKTDVVFQTLVRKLSKEDSDHKSNDEEVEENSGISIKKIPESKLAKTKSLPVMENEFKGLSMDMLELLSTGDMSDAVITNGEISIRVHRVIISARSSVLKEMFIEQKQDVVRYSAVVDIPSYILEETVIFLYVGLVYIENTKMAQDLHKVAERYLIPDLIDICSKHISK